MDKEYTWNMHDGEDTFRCAACDCYSPNKVGKILYDGKSFNLSYLTNSYCPHCGLEIRKSERGEKL